MKNEIQNLRNHAKNIVAEGNQRQLVFLGKSGSTLFESKLTIAAAVTTVLLLTGFISIPLVVIAAVIGMLMGLRVEVRHNEETVVIES